MGFPGGASRKEPALAGVGDAGDKGSSPGLGRSPGGERGNLENPMERGAWQATVRRVSETDRREAT